MTTSTTARLALATCAELPELDIDDHALRDALLARGVATDVVVWDDPTVDWGTYPHVLIRSVWDYTDRPAQFADWTRKVERTSTLLNPASVVGWNIDKTYLRDLETAGLPIVPTIWLDPERNHDSRAIHTRFPAFGDFVIKPTVSAGSRDTGRYDAGITQQRSLAITHAKNLLSVGRRVMIQRYLRKVDTVGETALVFIEGTFSHSIRKGALLAGPYREEQKLYEEETLSAREASDAERELAERVVAALPSLAPGVDGPLLYARVDLIPDDEGNPVVLELELTEPSLFFAYDEGSAERFADAVVARL
ncbi:ATP-grasp domain-containing protein [Cellulomonas sp. ICMP 17802]|uniref:ATP-grasp domain-containing protein n=1 Tax=Cellulomonas sp. ICMP 17802 TaxID=3239199 RepID=UPI00351B14E8